LRKLAAPHPRQPAREARHQVEPVGMFQRQDRAAAFVVIGQDGAGAVEGRRLGQAVGAEILAFEFDRKRQASAGAGGAAQTGDAAPAGGAETRIAHGDAAADALRREQQV